MPVSLDQKHNYGEFIVYFDEMKPDPLSQAEPAMIIKRGHGGHSRLAYVVFMGMAYKFVEQGSGPQYMLETAKRIAEILDIDQTRSTITRLCDAIWNHLEELLRMPPAPEKDPQEGVILTVDGKEV